MNPHLIRPVAQALCYTGSDGTNYGGNILSMEHNGPKQAEGIQIDWYQSASEVPRGHKSVQVFPHNNKGLGRGLFADGAGCTLNRPR